ncbi:hypothetical protein NHQ30_003467 [Ciborinia camelliae]|nr:hypothetical protein NHQ30_003467 [Ciborinia camelliae]
MAIFTGRKRNAINSPRYLTLRHSRRAVRLKKRALGTLSEIEDTEEPNLLPGQEKINSYWVPGLLAGPVHRIKVRQDIESSRSTDTPIQLEAEQPFFVDAPRFSLPEGSVHSVYPPPGYVDDHRILPHVVLTDPHLPWERRMESAISKQEMAEQRNQIPWVALITFTQEELRLSTEELARIFAETSAQLPKPVKQTPTLAVNMTVGDIWKTLDITTAIKEDPLQPKMEKERADFIFAPADLFTSLFSPFDEKNERLDVENPDPKPYQYLSHVREINTSGMAVAGVEEIGIFSIVVGNRSGILDNLANTSVSVHLVSIEAIQTLAFPINTTYVALPSLYSWNYTVQPPGMLNIHEGFTNLGNTLNVLRPPDSIIDQFKPDPGVPERLAKRLEDGYSMVKYRTQTGEETVALYHGPLTPTVVKPWDDGDEDKYFRISSNSGVDLQILDKQLGIMDITYSSAWQLGKTLALGDQAFAAALNRLRTAIHVAAMKEAKVATVKETCSYAFRSRTDVLGSLSGMAKHLDDIHLADSQDTDNFAAGGPLRRWHRRQLRKAEIPSLSFSSPAIEEKYLNNAIHAAKSLGRAKNGEIYDETNDPVSVDWMAVLAWVVDRMFLVGVPAHYFIPDPSHLEPESLRFFHIDPNWIDALIDGALSLGNHMGDDKDRAAIKHALNAYITEKAPLQNNPPQIPAYGFLLRSDLVSMFPDLKVTTLPDDPIHPPERAPLLRHEIIADGVMLAFTDNQPGTDSWDGLMFTQPPHQQRFAVASELEPTTSEKESNVDILRQYTVDRNLDPDRHKILEVIEVKPEDSDNLFIWGSKPGLDDLHILRLPRFADRQLSVLQEKMPPEYFNDDTATSALFAMQLNDPTYQLIISLKTSHAQEVLAGLSNRGQSAPRTLKRLIPVKIDKYRLPDEHEDDNRVEPSESHAGIVPFSRDPLYQPAPHVFLSLAPHVRALPIETAPPIPRPLTSTSVPKLEVPAHPPIWNCALHSLGLGYVQLNDPNLPQDLIFAVAADRENIYSTYKLKEFSIKVPLGNIDDRALMETYTGPGANMLSNLRFNVLPSFLKDGTNSFLKLRLLPRSSKGWFPVDRIKEMGFLLCLAQVNYYENKNMIDIETSADYQDDIHNPYTKKFTVLFRRAGDSS